MTYDDEQKEFSTEFECDICKRIEEVREYAERATETLIRRGWKIGDEDEEGNSICICPRCIPKVMDLLGWGTEKKASDVPDVNEDAMLEEKYESEHESFDNDTTG